MSSTTLPYIPPLGQLPRSLTISQIQFNSPPNFHNLSRALRVKGYFHEYILPTLPENKPIPTNHMDWEFGIRVDRPFHCIYPRSIPPRPKRKFPTGVKKVEQPVEETNFWELEAPDVDPYGHKEAEIIKPRFRICCEFVFSYLRALAMIGYGVLVLLALGLGEVAKGVMSWVVAFGKCLGERETWEKIISLAVALLVSKLLPGIEGTVKGNEGTEVLSGPTPLYVIMIPSYKLSELIPAKFLRHLLTASSSQIKTELRHGGDDDLNLCIWCWGWAGGELWFALLKIDREPGLLPSIEFTVSDEKMDELTV